MLPSSVDRVPLHTNPIVNKKINDEIDKGIEKFKNAPPDKIEERIKILEKEWDVERTLEANASTFAFVGTVLGITVNIYWLILPLIVTGFLFVHAIQGWCPPLPIFRRLNFRTPHEIDREIYGLKMIRGDFH